MKRSKDGECSGKREKLSQGGEKGRATWTMGRVIRGKKWGRSGYGGARKRSVEGGRGLALGFLVAKFHGTWVVVARGRGRLDLVFGYRAGPKFLPNAV